jgi:hypothetical protein
MQSVTENGIKYYILQPNFTLLKANKTAEPTTFMPSIPSFFSIKPTVENNEEYKEFIQSYEQEYGVVFEYVTTKEYKLVAIDDHVTLENIYNNAPDNIKHILEQNYGYLNGKRDSSSDADRQFARYLCELGYDGYATDKMPTISGGEFHVEILLCNAYSGVNYVAQVTSNDRIDMLLEKAKLNELSQRMKEQRKQNKRKTIEDDESFPIKSASNLFESPPRKQSRSFIYDSPPRKKLFGGKRKSKRNKNNRKRRKTIKKKIIR